jgi:lipoprotein-anchoring transpeptidase ErfK/SrfK
MKVRDRDISVISQVIFILYKMRIPLTYFRFGSIMFFLTRRKMIAGVSASAAASVAGCVSSDPNASVNAAAMAPSPPPSHPAVMADAVEPQYSAVYAEVKDTNFTVPAVKLSQVNSAFLRTNVAYATKESPGTIVVDPANHYLYRVEDGGRATRYGIGVGREGFVWYGEATIKSKQEWPDWYPPKEMIDRRPDLKKVMVGLQSGVGMHGGPSNPLGARAMYLWQGNHDTYFRIHGTNEPWTIGSSQSSGCIRMINQDAMDLYQKTPVGTRVVVLQSPGAQPPKLARV